MSNFFDNSEEVELIRTKQIRIKVVFNIETDESGIHCAEDCPAIVYGRKTVDRIVNHAELIPFELIPFCKLALIKQGMVEPAIYIERSPDAEWPLGGSIPAGCEEIFGNLRTRTCIETEGNKC